MVNNYCILLLLIVIHIANVHFIPLLDEPVANDYTPFLLYT